MSTERHAQKSRTRSALLSAARRLLSEQATLTIPAVAEAAGISRATAYRYFSDPSVLAAEAGLDISTKPYEDIVQGCADTRERVVAIALFFIDQAIEHEAEFRVFLSRWLDSWHSEGSVPTRGGRRVEMFRAALEGERDRIGDQALDQLVRALTVATGAEAMIALLDIAGADRVAARSTVAHMAEALVGFTLGTSQAGDPSPRR